MSPRAKNILRWIAILPASILASFIGYVIIIVYGRITRGFVGEGFFTDLITFVFSNIVMGYFPILIGCAVAPNYKKGVAIVLTSLYSMLSALSIILELSMHGISKTFLGCVIGVIAALVACVQTCYSDKIEN